MLYKNNLTEYCHNIWLGFWYNEFSEKSFEIYKKECPKNAIQYLCSVNVEQFTHRCRSRKKIERPSEGKFVCSEQYCEY